MILATHLIWTTYGTWLPGDPRGHWSPLFDFYGHLRAAGHRFNPSDEVTEIRASHLMKEAPKFLSPEEKEIAADVIGKVLGGKSVGNFSPGKPGAISIAHAVAIENSHVHLLIGRLTEPLDPTVGRIKGVSSSLILKLPRQTEHRRTWTASFWHTHLYRTATVAEVQAYITEHNLRRGLPAHPFAWLKPYPSTAANRSPHVPRLASQTE
jgi:hypothetical protein